MLDGIPLPVICAANLCSCAKWFVHLKSLMNHPILKEDEKFLWLWLATCSANNQSLSCSLSYEQISMAINKPVRVIHRCLLRLKVMGLLIGDIPIWYGEPLPAMVGEVRKIKLVLMEREFEIPALAKSPRLPQGQATPFTKVGVIGSLRSPLWMKDLLSDAREKSKKQWVRGVWKFVRENHNFRVMFRRMIH